MKKANYLFLFFLSFFFGCKRECKETTNSAIPVDKIDFNCIIPYKGYERLKFLRNNTDTVIFYGQGIKSEYQYTSTQEDCPSKIPLENKYLIFLDSAYNNSFLVQMYITNTFSNYCLFKINNKIVYNGSNYYITNISPPFISLLINNIKYDTLAYQENTSSYFYYNPCREGMLKFKSNNDIFELIP
jgi:hypothetical protein